MSLMSYILTDFTRDLKTMKYTERDGRKFFGGPEWENFKEDTKNIKPENLAYFCFSLFSMVCSDQNMHSNFRFAYGRWERRTKNIYPKFGWPGFSEHHEKPKFLLTVPEQQGVDFGVIKESDLKEFVDYNLKVSLEEFGIGTDVFFRTMIEDKDFEVDNSLFRLLYQTLTDL